MSAIIKEQGFPLFQVWKSLAKGYNMPKTARNRANFENYFAANKALKNIKLLMRCLCHSLGRMEN